MRKGRGGDLDTDQWIIINKLANRNMRIFILRGIGARFRDFGNSCDSNKYRLYR